jgi:hypothetical protein
MNRKPGIATRPVLVALLLTSATASAAADQRPRSSQVIPLKASTMIIEYNASAEDIGIQFFLDSDGWRRVEIFNPDGREIFSAETEGSLTRQGGGTELFLESVEPEIADLPFKRFFRRFPEGNYKFRARDNEGNRLRGVARFTHDIPAGPDLIMPVADPGDECAGNVSLPVTIQWHPVTMSAFGEALAIIGYELIVENDELNFDVKLPASTNTWLTIPDGLLDPGADYIFEVLAIEESGNQTITEGCFTTAG